MDSYEELPNGQVLVVKQIGDNQVKTHYCMFQRVELATNKAAIQANDVETATVTATVKDYKGNAIPYNGTLRFMVNDSPVDIVATLGVATISVHSAVAGEIEITANLSNSDEGSVIINAT
jgi:hypothetical protein